jgi:hypothetical protein
MEAANLLEAYNALSQIVYPASYDSLWLKTELEQDDRQRVLELSAMPVTLATAEKLLQWQLCQQAYRKIGLREDRHRWHTYSPPVLHHTILYVLPVRYPGQPGAAKSALATLNRDISNAGPESSSPIRTTRRIRAGCP